MPEWLPGLLIAIIAIIPSVSAGIRQRRKLDAEAESEIAKSYKLLVDDLNQQLELARQGCRIKDEEIRGLREENALLYEQKMAVIGHNKMLVARTAELMGEELINSVSD